MSEKPLEFPFYLYGIRFAAPQELRDYLLAKDAVIGLELNQDEKKLLNLLPAAITSCPPHHESKKP